MQWLKVDEHSLRSDMRSQSIFDFMSGRRDWHRLTSSQLADHIFKNFDFDERIVVDVYTEIVKETAYSANDSRSGFDSKENLKELMKYRFLTRIFGETSSALNSVEAIYKRLSAVPRIRENDQFWLQYAMSCMDVGNIVDAEAHINTALGIAKKKGADYSNHQILDQRVRLLLLKNTKNYTSPNQEEIGVALTDLEAFLSKRTSNMIYPIRSSIFIHGFVEEKIDLIEMPLRHRLLTILDTMQEMVGIGKIEKSMKGETEKLKKVIRKAILILKNA